MVFHLLLSVFLFAVAVVAAFAAGLWWHERAPGKRRATLLRVASIAASAFGGFVLAASVLADLATAELIRLWLNVVPMIAGIAAGLGGASRTSRRELTLVVEGDPLEHWKRLLLESDEWWFRSRAARELAALPGQHAEAEALLALAGRTEPHRRVRDAIGKARAVLRG